MTDNPLRCFPVTLPRARVVSHTLALAPYFDRPAYRRWPFVFFGGGFDAPRGAHKHHAVDIMAPTGLSVRAPFACGVAVVATGMTIGGSRRAPGAGFSRKGGNYLVLDSNDGRWRAFYSHLHEPTNDLVGRDFDAGWLVGIVGATGNATPRHGEPNPHLHFALTARTMEARRIAHRLGCAIARSGKVDPMPLLRPLYEAAREAADA